MINLLTLTFSIALLWSLVSISKDEMSELISMLSASIGQITAEDLLLINLSGKGFLKSVGIVQTFYFKC